jgi:hypothetical protein
MFPFPSFMFFQRGNFYIATSIDGTVSQMFECSGINLKGEYPVFDTISQCVCWYDDNELRELLFDRKQTFTIYGWAINEYGDINFDCELQFDVRYDEDQSCLVSDFLEIKEYSVKKKGILRELADSVKEYHRVPDSLNLG